MTARRVVVTDYTFPALDAEKAAAETAGAAFETHQCRTADDVAAAIAGADVAVVQFAPCDARAIAGLADGATVLRYGIGFDNIDVAAARARGVAVGYVPDYCLEEVADHTSALTLALLRKLFALDASVRAGTWDPVAVARPLPSFAETTIGFLGFGRIARAVKDRLAPFGFRFLAADPMLDTDTAGVERVDPEALFARADALLLHAPASPDTDAIVNSRTLAHMRKGAVIVNTARGSLIEENALADALVSGHLGAAALDVFAQEPLAPDSRLRAAPNLVLSPHAAWYSEAALVRLQDLVARDITTALQGGTPRCPVPGSTGS